MPPRLLLALVALVLFTTCAAVQGALKGVDKKLGTKMEQGLSPFGQVPQGRKCEAMQTTPVAWEEERSVGGVVALGLAQKLSGIMVEPAADGGTPRPDASELDQLNLYVAQVGATVAAYSSRPEIPWTFGVLGSDTVNAFSAPGGYVFVTRGLLRKVENESQLAGVLAHEVGHITEKHALRVYLYEKSYVCLAQLTNEKLFGPLKVPFPGTKIQTISFDGFTGKFIAKIFDPIIAKLVDRGFAQEDELEADAVAVDLVVAAGYDPREYEKFLATLPTSEKTWPNHPPPAERVRAVNSRMQSQWAGYGWEAAPQVPLDPRAAVARK